MAEHSLPTPVHDFICDRIRSIEQLEVLSLLHAERADSWTARRTVAALQITKSLADWALNHLTIHAITEMTDEPERRFRYAPAERELADQVDQLVASYGSSRVELLMLISHCAMDRIRTAHERAFAQAFLLMEPQKDR